MPFGSLKLIKTAVNLGAPLRTSCTTYVRLCLHMSLQTLPTLGVNFMVSHHLKTLAMMLNFLFYLNQHTPTSGLVAQPLGFRIIVLFCNFAGVGLPTGSPKGILLLHFSSRWFPLRPREQFLVSLINLNQNLWLLTYDANHPLFPILPPI